MAQTLLSPKPQDVVFEAHKGRALKLTRAALVSLRDEITKSRTKLPKSHPFYLPTHDLPCKYPYEPCTCRNGEIEHVMFKKGNHNE